MSKDVWKLIDILEKTTSRKDKEQLLINAFMNRQYDFFIGAQYAFDDLISFGVKQVALIDDADLNPSDMGSVSFDDFIILLNKLKSRQLTGHSARDAINAFAEVCHGPTWNYFYRRILLKNLRCGVDKKTINKILNILSAYPEALNLLIPTFGCQLAEDGSKEKNSKKITGRRFIQTKLDGARLLTILDKEDNTVRQYSRVGIENTNFIHITNELLEIIPIIKESIVLDGEIVHKDFSSLMSFFSKKETTSNDSTLMVFDIIPLKDFRLGYCSLSQEERHWLLAEFQTSGLFNPSGHVKVLPIKIIDFDTESGKTEFKNYFNSVLKEKSNDSTFEGVMIKDPAAPYECKRTDSWLKIKPYVSVTLEVISVDKGDPNGKFKDVIGNINCSGVDDDMYIEVSVSSIPDDKRVEWLTNPPIGLLAEIEADSFSVKEGRNNVYSLRFPRLKGFRNINPGDDKI